MRWNEPFQKLATCDADGGIFVWIQYEGRWSVELVNDRGAQVGMLVFSAVEGDQALRGKMKRTMNGALYLPKSTVGNETFLYLKEYARIVTKTLCKKSCFIQ